MHARVFGAALGIFAALAIPALGASTVETGGYDWVIPDGSVVGQPAENAYGITCPGEFVLSGNLHVTGAGDNPVVYLTPDVAVAAHLPRWKNTYRIAQLWFENADALLAAAIPAPMMADYRAHKVRSVDRHVVLDVDRFTVAIDCDGATNTVHFLRMHKPALVAQNEDAEDAC